jgi:plasmid stabilization system protein ParE
VKEIAFHPDMLAEFKAEIAYYEELERGLGAAFADEVFRIVDLARLFPGMGTPESGAVRSLLTKRFPFIIYYEVMNDCLWIWAVMHAAREPGYWKSRQQ